MLQKPISLGRKGRRSAQNKLPYCLRALGRGKVYGERSYAVLLCLVAGLKRAASHYLHDMGVCINLMLGLKHRTVETKPCCLQTN